MGIQKYLSRTVFILGLGAFLSLSVYAQSSIFFTVEGTRQGLFKGESPREKFKTKIPALAFQSGLSLPIDSTSGRPSGRRRHAPLLITKALGFSSPQFFQAAVTGEIIKKVVIEFYETNPMGSEVLSYVVTLSNANVVSIKQNTPASKPTTAGPIQEEISLVFQSIEVESKLGRTLASDVISR